jgi:hypothetical protein
MVMQMEVAEEAVVTTGTVRRLPFQESMPQ